MRSRATRLGIVLAVFFAAGARADVALFNGGAPDGRMASASRPPSTGIFEIETADDFVLPCPATINSATFVGLLPPGASLTTVQQVVVSIYHVFPVDSTDPPSGNVPTRVNSPADTEFLSRDSSASNELTFTSSLLAATFTASNSVQPGGIHPSPNQTTGGDGALAGEEVQFDVTFTSPIPLPAGHYFFVPQVRLSSGNFFWLSAAGPSVAGDLQSWTRDANLDPDWLRIGTDIVGGTTPPKFNAAFSLSGTITPLAVSASSANPLVVPEGVPITPVTFSATGGTGPFTFGETGTLPGLTLDPSGVLSGTPTQLGDFPITVTATDANGCTGTLAFTVRVLSGVAVNVPTLAPGALVLLALAVAAAGVFVLRR